MKDDSGSGQGQLSATSLSERYCVDCAHYVRSNGKFSFSSCHAPENMTRDMVSGMAFPAMKPRAMREVQCGKDGKLFEPKPQREPVFKWLRLWWREIAKKLAHPSHASHLTGGGPSKP